MSFTPTPEQLSIIAAARDTVDNLLISALAGAAKTSTLVLIAEALPSANILCLAFNKRIATEMQERLPPNCTAMTLNSLGHRAWGSFISKRVVVDTKKNYNILSGLIEKLSKTEKSEAYNNFADILRNIGFGKTCGYVPTGTHTYAKRLMDDDEFFAHLEETSTDLEMQLIRAASLLSINQGLTGIIDFDDQILLPTVFPAQFPQYPLVMVDEAQDLSSLNHATLRKLVRKRLIAVGDEYQAIYGFRGAHEDSMRLLQKSFEMKKHILSISFRCPKSIVKEAQWRAPHMRFPDWAVEGEVRSPGSWDTNLLPESATIICRNNAPIFSMAIKLLQNGRYPQIVGNDIGKSLIKIMKKFGPSHTSTEEVITAINLWKEEKLTKTRSPGRIHDQAACMKVFARQGKTLGDAIAYADHIMTIRGPITMLTGHKAKGLEWDDVFILDRYLIHTDEDQEANLLYVMQTRSKNRLTYVDSRDFIGEINDE